MDECTPLIDGLEGIAGMDMADIQALEEHLKAMRGTNGRYGLTDDARHVM